MIDFSLSGQTALVTGCSRGIGRAIATGLAEAGADIVGVSSSLSEDSGVAVAVRDLGRKFTVVGCDLANPQSVTDLVKQLKSQKLDILVNNAGIIRRSPAEDHKFSDWREVMEINVDTPFRLSQVVGKGMLERRYGRIIFIASLLSFQGGITVPGYAASKGAIAQLTKALSNEWAGRGVTVNAIAPGYIATDATAALREDPLRSKAILERIPAGRWGKPEDLASAAVFLASAAASYVTGQILLVDGGWMGR